MNANNVQLNQEIAEWDPSALTFSVEDVDGVPTLTIDYDQEYTIPIPNLRSSGHPYVFTSNTYPLIEFQFDDRALFGRYVRFYASQEGQDDYYLNINPTNENINEDDVFISDLSRRDIYPLFSFLQKEVRRQQRLEQANARAKGRILAAFRQTMGNKRPKNNNRTNGYWYEGPPNPVPGNLAAPVGPGNVIASFLTGKHGSVGQQNVQLKEIASRPLLAPIARRRKARKTRRRRN